MSEAHCRHCQKSHSLSSIWQNCAEGPFAPTIKGHDPRAAGAFRPLVCVAIIQHGLGEALSRARERFGLSPGVPVVSCYEAGRDGFWLHRYLLSRGIANRVVDSSSIEVSRRRRRVKTDRVDGDNLLTLLNRECAGERAGWRVVQVPSVADEDALRLHREMERLKAESQ